MTSTRTLRFLPRHDRSVPALALALAATVATAATASGCSGGADRPRTAASSVSPPPTSPAATSPAPTTAGPTPTAPSTSTPAGPASRTPSSTPVAPPSSHASGPRPSPAAVLADGLHPARIVRIDLARNAVAIDVVRFFIGEAAVAAAQQDGAAEIPPPNDLWIRNENPLVRTLPAVRGVPVVTNTLTAAQTGSSTRNVRISLRRLAQLPHVRQALVWVSVRGGTVTGLREQYLP